MREHLLGYLVGALDNDETDSVQRQLEHDEELRRQLEAIRRCLEPLAADRAPFEPPAGLALKTCGYVATHVETTTVRAAATASRWSFADLAVAATVLIAASAVFFPAVNQSRLAAQNASCQNNLRAMGMGLAAVGDANGGSLPLINTSGNDAVAGIYGAELREGGYVTDYRAFVCPGSLLAGRQIHWPTRKDLQLATGEALAELQRLVGGSYGYPLGYLEQGQWRPARMRSRPTYALMADQPSLNLANYQSDNHGGKGQNVLFEDGHVRYMRDCRDCPSKDDIFHNELGQLAPGTHVDDSVIGPSDLPPLGIRSPPLSVVE
jgi:hypothetical protein